MRYRSIIYVDIFADSQEEAEEKSLDLAIKIPNSFSGETVEMKHGSEISLVTKEPKNS